MELRICAANSNKRWTHSQDIRKSLRLTTVKEIENSKPSNVPKHDMTKYGEANDFKREFSKFTSSIVKVAICSQKRAKKIKLHFNKQHQTILLDSSHFHGPVALLKEEITFEMFFLQPALNRTYSLYFWLRDIVRNKARFLS